MYVTRTPTTPKSKNYVNNKRRYRFSECNFNICSVTLVCSAAGNYLYFLEGQIAVV